MRVSLRKTAEHHREQALRDIKSTFGPVGIREVTTHITGVIDKDSYYGNLLWGWLKNGNAVQVCTAGPGANLIHKCSGPIGTVNKVRAAMAAFPEDTMAAMEMLLTRKRRKVHAVWGPWAAHVTYDTKGDTEFIQISYTKAVEKDFGRWRLNRKSTTDAKARLIERVPEHPVHHRTKNRKRKREMKKW